LTDAGSVRPQLLDLLGGYMRTQALVSAVQLGIPDLVGDQPRDVDDLAAEADAHAPSLYRLLRLLASLGVFAEASPRSFVATPLSDGLRADAPQSLRYVALTFGAAPYRAWAGALHSFQTGEPAFDQVFGMPYFAFLEQHPQLGDNFDRAMASGAQARVAALGGYDWNGVSTVADIGGGTGSLLGTVLEANPRLRGIVFDLPHVAAKARASLEEAGLDERCQVVPGDFFTDPLPEADAYLLANILHDWDDDRALAILRNCHRSAAEDGRLLLLENVIPDDDEPSWAKQLDLHMLVMLGGKERSESEWRELLDEAGFQLVRIAPPIGTHLIEAVR
jgi:SAM-dependent methyltransferase